MSHTEELLRLAASRPTHDASAGRHSRTLAQSSIISPQTGRDRVLPRALPLAGDSLQLPHHHVALCEQRGNLGDVDKRRVRLVQVPTGDTSRGDR